MRKAIRVIAMLVAMLVASVFIGCEPASDHTVTFYKNNGTTAVYATLGVNDGETVTRPANAPQREGYEFVDWYADAEGVTIFDFTKPITQDTSVYAIWKENAPEQYKVTFSLNYNAESGATFAESTVAANGVLTEPETKPVRAGYEFTGWYKDAACTVPYTFSDAVTGNMTLYAGWKEAAQSQYKVTFAFNYNAEGGATFAESTVEANGVLAEPETDPVRDGYEFIGWYKDAACTVPYAFSDAVTGDLTLYAGWKEITSPKEQAPYVAMKSAYNQLKAAENISVTLVTDISLINYLADVDANGKAIPVAEADKNQFAIKVKITIAVLKDAVTKEDVLYVMASPVIEGVDEDIALFAALIKGDYIYTNEYNDDGSMVVYKQRLYPYGIEGVKNPVAEKVIAIVKQLKPMLGSAEDGLATFINSFKFTEGADGKKLEFSSNNSNQINDAIKFATDNIDKNILEFIVAAINKYAPAEKPLTVEELKTAVKLAAVQNLKQLIIMSGKEAEIKAAVNEFVPKLCGKILDEAAADPTNEQLAMVAEIINSLGGKNISYDKIMSIIGNMTPDSIMQMIIAMIQGDAATGDPITADDLLAVAETILVKDIVGFDDTQVKIIKNNATKVTDVFGFSINLDKDNKITGLNVNCDIGVENGFFGATANDSYDEEGNYVVEYVNKLTTLKITIGMQGEFNYKPQIKLFSTENAIPFPYDDVNIIIQPGEGTYNLTIDELSVLGKISDVYFYGDYSGEMTETFNAKFAELIKINDNGTVTIDRAVAKYFVENGVTDMTVHTDNGRYINIYFEDMSDSPVTLLYSIFGDNLFVKIIASLF